MPWKPVRDQLTQIRLAHAAHLLQTAPPHRSITEIAFAVGFNSSQYFATRFRKQHGYSPKQFRDELTRVSEKQNK